jgi:hypothetical protein
MLTTLIGLLICAVSGYAVVLWFPEFLTVLKGLLPICFFCGGLVAVVIGLTPQKKSGLGRADKDK